MSRLAYVETMHDKSLVHKLLTKEDEIALGNIIRSNVPDTKEYKEAFNSLLFCNLRLVKKIAMKFAKKTGADIDDLNSEGRIGLMTAIEKYDPEKCRDSRFATYATWWINQKIRIYLMSINTLSVPDYIACDIVKYNAAINRSEIDNQEQIDKEIMEKFDWDDKKIHTIKHANVKTVSLSTPVEFSNKTKAVMVGDYVKDSALNPFEEIDNEDKRKYIIDVIENLTPMEKDIIYSQILNDEKITLRELGEKYNFTCERIRQIRNEVLYKLKNKLSDFA